ncbi:MAG: ScpA family protein [Pseudomonadota bacterium]
MTTASESPAQSEMPFAVVGGQPYTRLPTDLYIPPDALEVFLEAFEGPLDLLLYLIRRQNLDILDIPIAEITDQYVEYIDLMQEMKFELAAEYLLMAAILAEIKSRMLLPRPHAEEDEEDDPRAELVRRLQEYERFKKAAEDLSELPRLERDIHLAVAYVAERSVVTVPPTIELNELLLALKDALDRAELFRHHAVAREPLSVRERMSRVLERIQADEYLPFSALFEPEEGRGGVVVTFLAILELLKAALLDIVQNEAMGPIYVKPA